VVTSRRATLDGSCGSGTVLSPAPPWLPLVRTGRALFEFPFETEKDPKKLLLHFVGVLVQIISSPS